MKQKAPGRQRSVFAVVIVIGVALGMGAVAQGEKLRLEDSFSPGQLSFHSLNGYEVVELAGGHLPEGKPGTPWLPARYVNVLLPSGARVTALRSSAQEVLVRKDIAICPAQPPRPLVKSAVPFVSADAKAYASAEKWPARPAVLGATRRLRGYTLVSVRLNPATYVPSRKELYLAVKISLEITYQRAKTPLSAPARNSKPFEAIISRLVLNSGATGFSPRATATKGVRGLPKGDMPTGAVDYLLITNDALSSAFQPLVDRRIAQGITAALITTETIYSTYSGLDNQDMIRNCIKDYYQNQGTLYVVLGGDDTIVPDRDCYVSCGSYTESHMPTDLYYGGLDGTWDSDGDGVYGEAGEDTDVDLDPEVWVGRIPVRTTTEASAYINKLIAYETATVTGFTGRVLLTGVECWNTYSGNDRPSDFRDHDPVSDSDIWDNRLYRDTIQPYWQATVLEKFLDTWTSWDSADHGDYQLNAGNLSTRLNQGYHHVLMATHGSTTAWAMESGSFLSSNAMSLTNADRPSIIYTIACNTGGFDQSSDPCLSEAFLRNANGGAVVYMGCSRYGWGSPGSYAGGTSFDYARQFYTDLFGNGRTILGEAFAYHKMAMASSSGFNGSRRWVQFGLNLQGDPAIGLLADEPGRSLQIDVPNGLETYYQTDTIPIRWNAGGGDWVSADKVKLDYSSDSGSTWHAIVGAENLNYDGASFDWVPSDQSCPPSSHYRVSVTYVTDPGITDASDADFSIVTPLEIVTSSLPAGQLGVYYSTTLEAQGGITPYTWSLGEYAETDPGSGWMGGGTAQGWHADDGSWNYTLPWPFTYYGGDYTSVWVCSNGFVDFASTSSDYSNTDAELIESVRIAPLWDDLRTDTGGDIFITETAEYVVIRWDAVTYSGGYPVNVELVLNSDGSVQFNYGAEHTGLSPTIGLSKGDGSSYTLSSRNGASAIPAYVSSLFSVSGLPEGLSLDSATGVISGTPQEEGIFSVSITVTDSGSPAQSDTKEFSLQIGSGTVAALTWSVAPPDGGTISVTPPGVTSASGSETYNTGQDVSLLANPATGYRFDHWNGDVADPALPSTTVTMDADKTVEAVFIKQWTLTVQSTPITGVAIAGTSPGTTDYSDEVDDGSAVSLEAPGTFADGDTDYEFVKWTVNGVAQPEGQTEVAFTITQATTAVAEYARVERTLQIQSTPIQGVDITGTVPGITNYSAQVDDNTEVTLTAPATVWDSGQKYDFVRWTVAGVPQPDGETSVSFHINADTTATAEYAPGTPLECIIDNTDDLSEQYFQVLSGSWRTNNGGTNRWDPADPAADYRWTDAETGAETARAEWVCTTLPAGTYEVFAWWPQFTYSMAENVAYEVHHSGGVATVRKDQNVDGGQWNSLGTYTFEAGLHVVQIHNGQAKPGSYVVADAVRFLEHAPVETGSLQVTLDPEEARTAGAQWRVDGGAWQDSGALVQDLPVGDHLVEYGPAPGWQAPTSETVAIVADQTLAISRTYTPMTECIVDNKDNSPEKSFSVISGTWNTNNGGTNRWDPSDPTANYRWTYAQSGSETARAEWVCTSLPAGAYEVYAWWPELTYSMGENVAYEVHHSGGVTTVRKDQNVNGGQWNSLGTYTFNAGSHVVQIHNGGSKPGTYVVADAVKFVDRGSVDTGSLQATLEPEEARTAGAQWRVDGGAWQDSGALVQDLPVGDHLVEYGPAPGWQPPPSETVTIVVDETLQLTRTYTVMTECIVDNKDNSPEKSFSVISGTWNTNNGGTNRWDPSDPTANYRWADAESGAETARARWECTSLPAGAYEVYAWWPEFTYSMGEQVAYEIHHAGSTATVRKDQNVDGGQWNSLGIYSFNAGSHVVQIHNGGSKPGSYVVADAVKFVDRGSVDTGSLQATLEPEEARTAGAQWRVDGGAWQDSGALVQDLPVGDHLVEYGPAPGWQPPPSETVTIVVDETLQLTRTYTVVTECIVDNKDNSPEKSFSVISGTWNTNDGGTNRWDPSDPTANYRWTYAQSGSETARAEWVCTSLPAGTYEVYAWWPQLTYSMGEQVAYEIHHAGSTATIRKDQNVDGGQWNSLGTYTFNAGSHVVQIHNGGSKPGTYVVADAVRFVKQP